MKSNRNDCTSADPTRYQRHVYRGPTSGSPSVPLEFTGGECSRPTAWFNTPGGALNIHTMTVDVVMPHPSPQPVDTQQAQQVPKVTLGPTSDELTHANVLVDRGCGDPADIYNPYLLSDLAPVPLVYAGNLISPM
ncbi:hypothetical protein PM082_005100 [Marasmius tenuissimus]|nr:hypothetical protein PM082_005100 [Marasmius tenuissimus]